MSKATDDLLDALHGATAEELIDIIRNGVIERDKEGNEYRVKAPAAYYAAAIKFLKDNDITADFEKSKPLSDLNDALADLPVFPEETPRAPH